IQSKSDSTIHYEAEIIGWSSEYPVDWKVISKNEQLRLEDTGKQAMEKTTGSPINGERTNLLWLRKNALNAFTSTIAPYDSAIDGSYSDLQEAINKITVQTYRDQGLSLSHTRGELLIDGILFKKQKLTILTPDESDTLMQQVVFDQLINDSTSLTISLMYNNQKDKETLYSIIQSSEFE